MKSVFTYNDLRKKAIEARGDLFEKGVFCRPGRRVRRKPRPQEELDNLFERAIERATRHKPYYDKDGKLILPFFLRE